jgi:hypothetical protein
MEVSGKEYRYKMFCDTLLKEAKKCNPTVTLKDLVTAFTLFRVITEGFEWKESDDFYQQLQNESK